MYKSYISLVSVCLFEGFLGQACLIMTPGQNKPEQACLFLPLNLGQDPREQLFPTNLKVCNRQTQGRTGHLLLVLPKEGPFGEVGHLFLDEVSNPCPLYFAPAFVPCKKQAHDLDVKLGIEGLRTSEAYLTSSLVFIYLCRVCKWMTRLCSLAP